ncbi:DMT family transporter [Paenibacillus sp. 1011MAR3C5]|uniref:EamA family transporter n=1 Tax=Paenibacillus sp. 1011MAR3C5 TaxID=1675787 RepID=UPI000E6C9DF9|nr:DMT family transporter [Paenibacillus sp. 1011MAR3C5]RJE90235.1 DMT family transporter [Paenibacillus sp. 1011MAR3C5]
MKYMISVFVGAASYGVLSTFVVLAYGEGYKLGEVVGSQLMIGFLLSWLFATYIERKQRKSALSGKAGKDSGGDGLKQGLQRLTWKTRLLLMAAGLPTAITGLVYYHSLRYIPASLAILLLFQFTWIGVLVQCIRQKKRPNRAIITTLVILLGGTILAAGIMEHGGGSFHPLGVTLGFLAAISYTLFILFSGNAAPEVAPATRSKWMMAGGMIFVFILFPPEFLWNGDLFSSLFLFGTLLGLFGAFIPPLLFAYGVPHIGEGMAGILGAAELPVAVLLSSVVLHEQVSWLQWAGVVLVLAGVSYPELIKLIKRSRRISSGVGA